MNKFTIETLVNVWITRDIQTEKSLEEVVEEIKVNGDSADVWSNTDNSEVLFETERTLSPEENNGGSTIIIKVDGDEVFSNDDNIIRRFE